MREHSPGSVIRRRTFAALAYPNYRLWFFGQMTSLFGTWMQATAQGYLVYELTHSEAYLGYVGFASGIASWAFMLYGGALADRIPRRRLLVVTQMASIVPALALSILAFTHVVAPWHIVVLAFGLGIVNAFDAPARQSFVLEMVDRSVLTNAIALNSTMFNIAMAVGPAIGGLAYALFGPGWCFAINAVSFTAVIAALLAMRLSGAVVHAKARSALQDIRAGLRAVVADRRILAIMIIMIVQSLFGNAFATLMPAWAVQILHGDARTNGFLQSARGVGALLAALAIATLSHGWRKGRVMVVGSFLFPLLIALFALTRSTALSLVALVGVGASNIVVNNLANAVTQTLTPDALRGRVMAVYMLTFFGFGPIGSLVAGASATAIGVPLTVALGACGMLACAVAISVTVPALRRLN